MSSSLSFFINEFTKILPAMYFAIDAYEMTAEVAFPPLSKPVVSAVTTYAGQRLSSDIWDFAEITLVRVAVITCTGKRTTGVSWVSLQLCQVVRLTHNASSGSYRWLTSES